MPHINKKRGNTRLEIIRLGAHLFIEEGYSCTTVNKIAKTLDLSPGNVTFYFPTKEHLLAVLVDELFDFQTWLMEYEAREGASSLLSYCLELTSIAAACEDDEVAKDKKNSAAVGIAGKIRDAIENFFLAEPANTTDPSTSFFHLSTGYSEGVDYSYLWSLEQYKSTVNQEKQADDWDELEKSVIASVADDVIVGVKVKQADIVIVKKFA